MRQYIHSTSDSLEECDLFPIIYNPDGWNEHQIQLQCIFIYLIYQQMAFNSKFS